MITESDLYQLGYRVKTRLTDTTNSVDFKHQDFENRTYLVNLDQGEVHIVYPTNAPAGGSGLRTDNLNVFKRWHNEY